MEFNKLILGEYELEDFEQLLLRENYIELVHKDIQNITSVKEEKARYASRRVINKSKILTFMMLFEKIDATNLSIYDLSQMVDLGIVNDDACIVSGTDREHPTSKIVDSMMRSNRAVMTTVLMATDAILKAYGLIVYSKNHITEEQLLEICNCYWFGSRQDFYYEFLSVLRTIVYNFSNRQPFDSMFSQEEADLPVGVEKAAAVVIDELYRRISMQCDDSKALAYKRYTDLLDGHIQTYSVPSLCLNCKQQWANCCEQSELLYDCAFECEEREKLGAQRYAKLNGLITSQVDNGCLFDNSLKFNCKNKGLPKLVEDVYHIVNVDMAPILSSLPVPATVSEALRLRNREEIRSFRNIFLSWAQNIYDGKINEAEYIKKDFDVANKFFEKKKESQRKKTSIIRCTFEALGNQVPYISNIVGAISPFMNRRKILEEEKHKWLLLTR